MLLVILDNLVRTGMCASAETAIVRTVVFEAVVNKKLVKRKQQRIRINTAHNCNLNLLSINIVLKRKNVGAVASIIFPNLLCCFFSFLVTSSELAFTLVFGHFTRRFKSWEISWDRSFDLGVAIVVPSAASPTSGLARWTIRWAVIEKNT
jgi:hypothetical protein